MPASYATHLNIVTEHLAPFQIVEKGEIGGLSTEIVKATLDESGYSYQIDAHPWALSYNRAKQEPNTCIYSLARIPQRETVFEWIGHITTSTTSFYGLSENDFKIEHLDDAKQYRTAVINSDVTHHFLVEKGFVENENLYVMNNYDSLLQLLEIPSRQIDLVILNDDLLNNRVKSSQEAQKYKSIYLLKELSLDFYLACSPNTPTKVTDTLKKTMQQLEKKDGFKEIRAKWKKRMTTYSD